MSVEDGAYPRPKYPLEATGREVPLARPLAATPRPTLTPLGIPEVAPGIPSGTPAAPICGTPPN